jgi:hypothetical protein
MIETNGSQRGWVTVKQAAEVLGVSHQAVRQVYIPDLPADRVRLGNRHAATTVYGPALVELLVIRELRKRIPFEDDLDLTSGTSDPELRRCRLAKAKLLELELCQRMKVLQPAAYWREMCGHVMAALRRLSRRVGHWPAEFRDEFNDAVAESREAATRHFGLDQDRNIDRVEFCIYLVGSTEPIRTLLEPQRNDDETTTT